MSLFQNNVVKKYTNTLDKKMLDEKWQLFITIFHNTTKQDNIRNSNEEQYQDGFLRDLFVRILGYTFNPDVNFNLISEKKNETNSKKADGAIILNENVHAVIELKGTETTDLSKIETQAFGYKNNQKNCNYVIISNFEKLRFYIDNTTEYLEFNLFKLSREEFDLLYICLSLESMQTDLPKKIKNESVSNEDKITKELYKDYSAFRKELFTDIEKLNPQYDRLLLFKKTQKLLDRFLFIFFAEDRQLLPTNLIFSINLEWQKLREARVPVSLYDRYKMYFQDLNTGARVSLPAFGKHTNEIVTAQYDIYAYNGGLFQPDDVLDTIAINDDLLYKHTKKLSEYDFESEVDVNILGHIFENSLNEIDEITNAIEGQEIDKTKTKRKKDGVFYTPKYITKYIVDNTIGKLCEEKKTELTLDETKYTTDKRITVTTKKKLIETLDQYRKWLLQLTIVDPACGSGAFLNQALEFLIAEHRYIDELQAKLFGDALVLSDVEGSILENNLFGVDLNEESVEIAKLSLWLRTAQRNRKLNSLNNNIKCGNSLIDDTTIAGDKAFNWQNEFPKVFEKGGFDVVIGNPPYVQIQSMGSISNDLEKRKFESFEKTGDLYCLFYELGNVILKEYGLLGYITSNKWLRANYGKSLRNYLIKNTQPLELLDLGSGIFESATVDSNILIFEKTQNNQKPFIGLDISKEKSFLDFTIYENKKIKTNPKENDIWTISNPIESQVKSKIESIGTPLKEWKIEINYGIKTGFNDAFIIDENTRSQLIQKDSKAAEIIFPILRGRDINRYKMDFQNLYLINSHNGYGNIPEINIQDYPSIKEHLDKFYFQLEKRGDKGKTPYNLRNCAYVNDFFEENLFYPDICQRLSFTKVNNIFSNNTGYYLKTSDEYLLSILNSTLINYYYKTISAQLGDSGIRSFTIYIENIPIPKINKIQNKPFIEKADLMLSLNKSLQEVSSKFSKYFSGQFKLEKLSSKLEKWYELSFEEFIKEINKTIKTQKSTPLTKKDEFDWIDLFEENKQKANKLQTEIAATDKTIDKMVYELYGLTEEEIKIVENS